MNPVPLHDSSPQVQPDRVSDAAYWSARLAMDTSLEAVGWQGLGRAYNYWLYRQRARVLGRVVRARGWDAAPPRVLEIGPGNGFWVRYWQRLGVRDLVGLEIAPAAVQRLVTRFPEYRFVVGDIGAAWSAISRQPSPVGGTPSDRVPGMGETPSADRYPFGGGFELVTAFDVLFHITDDAAYAHALTTIADALRPGGYALITDLFPEGETIRMAHHVSRDAATVRVLLARAGLQLEHRWPVFVLMHPWAGVRAAWLRRLGRAWWWSVERLVSRVPGGGAALGALLYAVDGALTHWLPTTPSTELWLVRKT